MIEYLPRIISTAVTWDTLACGKEASFLLKAYNEGHSAFYKKQRNKQRLFYRSNGTTHKLLDQKITEVLKEKVKPPNRIEQSLEDIRLLEEGKYRYLISDDLRIATNSK